MARILTKLFLFAATVAELLAGPIYLGLNQNAPEQGGGGGNGLLAATVAYWSLDEGSGLMRADSHSGGYDLTDTDEVDSVSAKNSNGASFDATASDLSLASAPVLQFGGKDRSVSFWCRFYEVSSTQSLLSKWESANDSREVAIRLNAGAIELIWYENGGGNDIRFSHTTSVLAGVTYHIAFGRRNSDGQMFISVNAAAETEFQTSSNSGSGNLYLGSLGPSLNSLDGWLDEVAVFDKYLSATDIENLYNSGAGLFYANFD